MWLDSKFHNSLEVTVNRLTVFQWQLEPQKSELHTQTDLIDHKSKVPVSQVTLDTWELKLWPGTELWSYWDWMPGSKVLLDPIGVGNLLLGCTLAPLEQEAWWQLLIIWNLKFQTSFYLENKNIEFNLKIFVFNYCQVYVIIVAHKS